MSSMRRRLVVATGLTALVVVALASSLVWYAGHRLLAERLDGSLRDLAEAGMHRAVMEHFWMSRWRRDHPDEDPPPRTSEHRQPFVLYARDGGAVLHRSPQIDAATAEQLVRSAVVDAITSCTTGDGIRWRIFTRAADSDRPPRRRSPPGDEARPGEPPPLLAVLFARSEDEVRSSERGLAWALVVVCLLTAGLCAGAAFIASRSVLRPITRLRDDIARIRADELHARIGLDQIPVELAPVVTCLNEAIGRLQQAFEREKGLTADLAHELRTPLAAIRSELEQVIAAGASSAVAEPVANALAVTRQMQTLAERILLLARLEAGTVPAASSSVDLADAVTASWGRLAALAVARGLSLHQAVPVTACLQTDPALLGIALDNVLGNAVAYSDPGSQVAVDLGSGLEAMVLVITNVCHLPAPLDGEAIFRPYWRGDATRADTGAHAGLGLALVRRLMTVMGGRVEARHVDNLFRCTLAWPAARAPGEPAPG